MELPLKLEVAAARVAATRAETAMWLKTEADSLLSAFRTLQHGASSDGGRPAELPGEEAIARGIASFDELAGLHDLQPSPAADLNQRLHARKLQLQALATTLAPIAAEHNALSRKVHQLQHQQMHLLKAPEYASIMAELTARSDERLAESQAADELGGAALRLEVGVVGVDPITDAVHADLLRSEAPAAVPRAKARLIGLVETLADAAAQAGLDLTLPPIDDEPWTEARIRSTLDEACRAAAKLSARATELRAEQRERRARAEAATAWITDRTG